MRNNDSNTQQKGWLGKFWTGVKETCQKVLAFFSPKKPEPSLPPQKYTIDREALRRDLREQMYQQRFEREYPHEVSLMKALKEKERLLLQQDQIIAETKQLLAKGKQILAKQDQVLAEQKHLLTRYNQVLAKQDQVLSSLTNQQQSLHVQYARLSIRSLFRRSAPCPSIRPAAPAA